jgi:hypothetical protein
LKGTEVNQLYYQLWKKYLGKQHKRNKTKKLSGEIMQEGYGSQTEKKTRRKYGEDLKSC